ncbi:MAG TPA: nucleoside deaminase [Bdellovibrionota bacterium]|nr:nucleoside deaminase [Bdellovibrionota bacterium]
MTDWMNEALRLAEKAAAEDEVPVGAVVVHGDRIVGRGYNQRETRQSPMAHAEILAIDEASRNLGTWRLVGATLFVTLEPCPMCLAALQQARIDAVVYGASDPKGGAISLGYLLHEDLRTNHRFAARFEPSHECGEILTKFFRQKRQGSTQT